MRCLIVGQGIAGSALAWTLLRRGVQVRVADAGFAHQSSAAAAGIINPVTGKRYVKTWRFDEFFPAARSCYQAMEAELNCPGVWQERPILRLLAHPQEINDWSARLGTPGYAAFLGERRDAGEWTPLLRPGFHVGEIRQAARVEFPLLLSAFRRRLEKDSLFQHIHIGPAEAAEFAREFDYLIFCEGYRSQANPFFPGLAWQLSKGEGCILRFPGVPDAAAITEMVKRELILVPLGDGTFWAGASYNWTFEDNGPSTGEQDFLEERLRHFIDAPYEVLQRFGAVRPTVKDRRPYLGISPLHRRIVLFNGLGTKGALLAPFWAEHLADHLLEGKPLDPEVDIQRFR